MQRGDLIVEAVAALIEAARRATGEHHTQQLFVDGGFAVTLLGERHRDFQKIEGAPGIAVRSLSHHGHQIVGHDDTAVPYSALGIRHGTLDDLADIVDG